MIRKGITRLMAVGVLGIALGTVACSDDNEVTLNLVQTLSADSRFDTLVIAIEAAGLEGDLSATGPFTVFAPTDEAFAALPAGVLDAVLADTDLLTEILLYHVAAGRVLSTDLSDGQTIMTLQGSDVTIDLTGGVQVNDANVVDPDILATNGVAHVVDAVLLPPTIMAERLRLPPTGERGETTKLAHD